MGGVVSSIGNFFQNTGKDFTPQNGFQATDPAVGQAQWQNFQQLLPQLETGQQYNQLRQNQLANALQAQANGHGPSLAQAQLRDATNRNIQQTAGLIGSQHGLNPGLATRLAAQNTAGINQQAADQSAMLRAQEQLAARQQLGGLYSNIGQSNLNQQQLLQSALSANNATRMQAQGLNAGASAQNAAANQRTTGGFINAAGSLLGMSHGGMVPHYADGGGVDPSQAIANQIMQQYGTPVYGAGVGDLSGLMHVKKPDVPFNDGNMAGGPMDDKLGSGSIDNLGTYSAAPDLMTAAVGGKIPGKAKVKGDSESNDTVPALLSPGEVVIPRSIVDDPEKVKEFVAHIKKQKKPSEDDGMESGFGKVLEAHRKLGETLKALKGK